MESISLKHVISTAHALFPAKYSVNPTRFRKIGTSPRHFSLVLYSKKWDFQDFQSYATPKELLQASEAKIYRPSSLEQIINLFRLQKCECLYKVKLQTSGIYGSTLTDSNSGVLLCLIDESNNSILQRIPACQKNDHSFRSEDKEIFEVLNFQQGSVDEFIFEGPTLGKIAAVWIGLKSGQWRFGNLSLTVFCQHRSPSTEAGEEAMQLMGFQYDFDLGDVLLGEGSDISMLELRPCLVTDFSETGFGWLDVKPSYPSLLFSNTISGEESMKEYADLKFSLFLYDAILILAGSSIASILVGQKAALAFLTGGIGGFVYLLLLQRSVDGLPAPELVSTNSTKNPDRILAKFKGPLSTVALAFVFAVIAAKYTSGEFARVLTPNDLIYGMGGFLMCKISVLLAAFKPMQTGARENN